MANPDCENETAAQAQGQPVSTKRKAGHGLRVRKKPSYMRRKEEHDKLFVEAKELSLKVASMRRYGENKPDPDLVCSIDQNAQLQQLLRQQRYSLRSVNNIVSDWLRHPATNPLATFIHLTQDKEKRRRSLLELQSPKIADARRFLMEQSIGFDLLQPYSTEYRFMTDDGDYYCTRFDITQFEGVKSIKQVYEALMFYVGNIDTSIAEELGHIALREDYDRLDNRFLHQRVASWDNNGVMHETNAVVFSQLTDCDESYESSGIIATDFVDVDDLFPYRPDTSVRRDIIGAIMITAIRRPDNKSSPRHKLPAVASPEPVELLELSQDEATEEDEELAVVMRRSTFNLLRRSDLTLSNKELRESRESMVSWSDIMIKATRNRLLQLNEQPIDQLLSLTRD